MDQIIGIIGRLQPQLGAVAFTRQGSRHDNVVLDPFGGEAEHSGCSLELRVEIGVNHLFLASKPIERPLLAEVPDLALADNRPVRFSRPAGRREGLRIAIGNPDLVDIFAEPDIRCSAAELDAARNIENAHFLPPNAVRQGIAARG